LFFVVVGVGVGWVVVVDGADWELFFSSAGSLSVINHFVVNSVSGTKGALCVLCASAVDFLSCVLTKTKYP